VSPQKRPADTLLENSSQHTAAGDAEEATAVPPPQTSKRQKAATNAADIKSFGGNSSGAVRGAQREQEHQEQQHKSRSSSSASSGDGEKVQYLVWAAVNSDPLGTTKAKGCPTTMGAKSKHGSLAEAEAGIA
jgi:hypothetical protein